MRLSTRIHGFLDLATGLLLIALPWLGGFATGGPEQWVPVALGATILVLSLFTDYEIGRVRRIGMPVHLWIDALGGLFLAASPWVLGFDQRVWMPHLVVGLAELLVAGLTNTVPSYERRRAA